MPQGSGRRAQGRDAPGAAMAQTEMGSFTRVIPVLAVLATSGGGAAAILALSGISPRGVKDSESTGVGGVTEKDHDGKSDYENDDDKVGTNLH
eukprot:3932704-Rhodomonas_salina.1